MEFCAATNVRGCSRRLCQRNPKEFKVSVSSKVIVFVYPPHPPKKTSTMCRHRIRNEKNTQTNAKGKGNNSRIPKSHSKAWTEGHWVTGPETHMKKKIHMKAAIMAGKETTVFAVQLHVKTGRHPRILLMNLQSSPVLPEKPEKCRIK